MTEPVSAQTTAAIESAIHIGEKLLASKRRLAAAVALLQFLERSFAAEIDGDKEIPGANAVDFLVPFIVGEVRPFLASLAAPVAHEPNPEQFAALGAWVAQVLDLRSDLTHRDRFSTSWGNKTPEGIGRVTVRLVDEWRSK